MASFSHGIFLATSKFKIYRKTGGKPSRLDCPGAGAALLVTPKTKVEILHGISQSKNLL